MTPFKFNPILKSIIWGGDRIASLKEIETDITSIGESWEISGVPGSQTTVAEGADKGLELSQLIDKYGARLLGEDVYARYGNRFPLLVKIIDAHDNLSVQVHPDDALAARRHNCPGKTEIWYILDREDGAKIYDGLCRELTPETYKEAVADNTIMDYIACHESNLGDVFFLPAGRVHAIGAGNLLLEIQQTSDITYRIYDYDRRDAQGNPRQLHTEEAADAIDYKIYPEYKSTPEPINSDTDLLAECDYFSTRLHRVNGNQTVDYASGRFLIVSCTEGNVEVDCDNSVTMLKRGETILVPAERSSLTFAGSGAVVTSYVPAAPVK